MERAYSVDSVIRKKFHALPFDGVWKEAMGCPELAGTWTIRGAVKNGKTTFAMQLAKYLSGFTSVLYNSVEEGVSMSMQGHLLRAGMKEAGSAFNLLDREGVEDLVARLHRKRSASAIIIDTLPPWDLSYKKYLEIKDVFRGKLFVYVLHGDKQPEGLLANRIYRDSDIAIRVEGFRAFPVGRYGGGEHIDIYPERAVKYWANK